MQAVTMGLWKGCLGGIGLALVFFVISGLTYLILIQTALPLKMILLLTVGSGPIVGTFGFGAILLIRARHSQIGMIDQK